MSGRPLVAIFLGTRPEAIKLAPVIQRFRVLGLPSAIIGTGQHLELVDQVLNLFAIRRFRLGDGGFIKYRLGGDPRSLVEQTLLGHWNRWIKEEHGFVRFE
jgi:hypothetical protein